MALPFLLILGMLLVTWSFLSVLGNERQRHVQARRAAEPPAPPPSPPAARGSAHVGR